ncbi:RNA polymerase sigma factor SigI [Paenibacillus beijingensis]|uniref:RNA polymerase sigma factor SigI n=1 Tax=Paenibacillus beijingensis TaxID=1126833 RepID=A0A0D5NEN1_9BACL|nr:RNA polymerase sigma factor SigI [Paenibacillus beijingensis]AJY73686.1 RNA polymerase sigma factor SigI [Paenibacillus beijingensis]
MLLIVLRKWFGKKEAEFGHTSKGKTPRSPEEIIARIREGESALREELIGNYRPYIAKVTSRFCKRYIDPETDDEFSIAIIAFNEAIDQFSHEAGKSFLGFAETVIRRRLIDHVRKEQRQANTVPYSSFDTEDEDQQLYNRIETVQAVAQYEIDRDAENRGLDIAEYSLKLREFGIAFTELAETSPKHADSRRMLIGIAMNLTADLKLVGMLMQKKRLPVKELAEMSGVSRKTVERNRKYIIAIALIIEGDYPFLKRYIQLDEQHEQGVEGVGS